MSTKAKLKHKTKKTSKDIRIKITAEMLIEAFVELVYFSSKVTKVKIIMSRHGANLPTHDVNINCSGRGRVKGQIVKGVFHGTIYGTKEEIRKWEVFFNRFIKVPEFSLHAYIRWCKNGNTF